MRSNTSGAAPIRSLTDGAPVGLVTSLLIILAGSAAIAIAAKIKVPFYPVPMTLQTLAVMAIAASCGSRLAVLAVLAYLAEGLAGLPVFTNTPPAIAGPAYFLGPTGGFLVGFVAMAAIVGLAADRGFGRSVPKLILAMLIGELVMMALGFSWFAFFAQLSDGRVGPGTAFAWQWGVAPFIPGDLLKILLAALAVPAVWSLLGRRARD